MLIYKYHVVLLKDNVIIEDRYYNEGEMPDNVELKKLVERDGADELIVNTIADDNISSINKEKIDINSL